MTQHEAEAAAHARLGPQAVCQYDAHAPTETEREAARQAFLAAERDTWSATRARALRQVRSSAHRYRCTVGRVEAAGGVTLYLIDGQGDTWEEALAACTPPGVSNA